MFQQQGRQVGVRVADSQLSPKAEDTVRDKTVLYAVRCEMVASRWAENGKTHDGVLLKVGEDIYYPPNAEQWAAALREVMPWLAKAINAKLAPEMTDAPKEDTVDVVASSLAQK